MGRKHVGDGLKAPSLPKKAPRAPPSSSTPSSVKGNKDVYPLILPPSTRGLHFVSDVQRGNYAHLTTRKTSEQKFFHVDSLRTLGLLDDMLSLMNNLGWMEYIQMQ